MFASLLAIALAKPVLRKVRVKKGSENSHSSRSPASLLKTLNLNSEEPEEVVEEMTRILNQTLSESDQEYAHLCRARAYLKMGKYQEAEDDLQHASDPEIEFLIEKGKNLVEKVKTETGFSQKLEYLNQLFDISPKFGFVLAERARMALEEGDVDGYLRLSRKALVLDPADSDMFMERARFLFCDGYLQEALSSLRMYTRSEVVRKERQNLQRVIIGIRENMSAVNGKIEKGNIDAALERIRVCNNSCTQYCRASSVVVVQIGMAKAGLLQQKGDTKGCLELLTELINTNSRMSELFVSRGRVYAETGSYNLAINDFRNALSLDPDNGDAHSGYRKAKIAQKRSENGGSLYDVLGVSSEASGAQIREAFNNKTKEWNPDQFSDPAKKKEAEEKMKRIKEAYEILGDREHRADYDAEDADDYDFRDDGSPIDFGGFPFFQILRLFEQPLGMNKHDFPGEADIDPFYFFQGID